jgi:hypothetical protein
VPRVRVAFLTSSATSGAIISINASNVRLDFAGHYISGPSSNDATELCGVYAYECGTSGGEISSAYGIIMGAQPNANNIIDHCTVTSMAGTSNTPNVYGLVAQNGTVSNSSVSGITSGNSGAGVGIDSTLFAVNNNVNGCDTGLSGVTKYKDMLTSNCGTTYSGGTSVGTND